MVWGPRQVGKTTMLSQLPMKSEIYLDDLHLRHRAQTDPEFLLSESALPCLIDEVQYAPNLFPEVKKLIDRKRREELHNKKSLTTLYYFTGSNKTLLDLNVKESLAGRCQLFTLHGLSVNEVSRAFPDITIKQILIKGGFPQLYTTEQLSPIHYLNDYITSYLEKDIALSAGIQKVGEYETFMRLLGARTAQFLNVSDICQASRVNHSTVNSWIHLLVQNRIVDLVTPYLTNLSSRIVKMPKLHFLDLGLCSRLQGHVEQEALWNSPQSGALFESLVYSEILKTRDHFVRDWQIFTWRTKDGAEIDFIVAQGNKKLLIEAKLGIQSARPIVLDPEAKKVFTKDYELIVVTAGGESKGLGSETTAVPIKKLANYLLKYFET